MEKLVMYTHPGYGALFCLAKDWDRIKKSLHGRIDYMFFPLRSVSPLEIARKIKECSEGTACPSGGGHLCMK